MYNYIELINVKLIIFSYLACDCIDRLTLKYIVLISNLTYLHVVN